MTQPSTRLRIRFTKKDELRWISHRDLARVWERLLRRAAVPLAFSQGFHPKPKISFPSALALGIEALDEVVELEVVGAFDLDDLRARIAAQMPQGMQLLSADIPLSKARYVASTYCLELPENAIGECRERMAKLLQSEFISIDRDGKQVSCLVQQPNFDIRLEDNRLFFTLPNAAKGATLRPGELLDVLNLKKLLESGAVLQRVQVHLDEGPQATSSPQVDENYESYEHDSSLLL